MNPALMPAADLLTAPQVADFMAAFAAATQAGHWDAAYQDWLYFGSDGRPRATKTVAAYNAAWLDFRACVPVEPWQVTPAHVAAWQHDMSTRPIARHVAAGLVAAGRRAHGVGLSRATQSQYLAALSSFYAYCADRIVADANGELHPLYAAPNPVAANRHPERRTLSPATRSVDALTLPQLRALFAAIARGPRSVQALRDTALLAAYLQSGGSLAVCAWTWDHAPSDLPGLAAYHAALGQPADGYIFTSLRAGRGAKPLSAHEVSRLFKRYARAAGLATASPAGIITLHTLRRTAQLLQLAAGSDPTAVSRLLGPVGRPAARQAEWAKAWSLLGISPVGAPLRNLAHEART